MDKITSKLRKKYNRRTVNILGTEYLIRFENAETIPALKDLCGYCSYNSHEVIINQNVNYFKDKSDDWITNDIKCTLRHELIHAFFNESGLSQSSGTYDSAWAQNEEMVDWIALQSPKIFKVFIKLDLIEQQKEKLHETKSEKTLFEKIKEENKKYQERNKKENKKCRQKKLENSQMDMKIDK